MIPAMPFTQTTVTIPAGASTSVVTKDNRRRYLAIQNIGTGDCNLGFAGSAAADSGWLLASGGGGMSWEISVPTNAVHAYSTAGTTLILLVG